MKGLFGKGSVTAGAVIALAAVSPSIATAVPPGRGASASPGKPAQASPGKPAQASAGKPAQASAGKAGQQLSSAADGCPSNALSQPFLAWGDTHEYTLLSGESVDNVGGLGWQLSGGAHLSTATLQDGKAGQVLDMPAGSHVVTPAMCVNASNYPMARAMVSNLSGTQGVAVYVSYASDGLWGWPLPTGMVKSPVPGWGLSRPIMLHAGELRGEHLVRFTLVAYGGEYQLYNFYVDPRRGH
jgi:hypothetical protein